MKILNVYVRFVGKKSYTALYRPASLPPKEGRDSMKLYLRDSFTHVDLITDLGKFAKAFLCKICGQAFKVKKSTLLYKHKYEVLKY